MVTFNIRETGNELLRILEKELLSRYECRLSIDLLIPDVLKGDKDGLCSSILQICRCLDGKLLNASVNIELSKVSHPDDSLLVKIDIKGITDNRKSTQQFAQVDRTDIDTLLGCLSYPTTFSANGLSIRFSFTMLFSAEPNSKAPRTEMFSKKVLLVEDDDMTALVFISFMEEWDYAVTRVADGVAAVDAATTSVYDIILMDTFLPKMSGAEAIRKIRERDKKTPIVALTTSPIDKDFTNRYAGANDVLVKPVSGADLQRMLRQY
jgi:CheY-like chemotaxis protein